MFGGFHSSLRVGDSKDSIGARYAHRPGTDEMKHSEPQRTTAESGPPSKSSQTERIKTACRKADSELKGQGDGIVAIKKPASWLAGGRIARLSAAVDDWRAGKLTLPATCPTRTPPLAPITLTVYSR